MAVFNAAKREIDIKIVYYGPALCGKTTNVQCIHKMLSPHQRGDLMSLATKDDRTLFFDFLPIELGDVKGFKTRFHVYTVPGQVYYALTRRAVLTGVDGVVFVADSQKNKLQENIESLKDLNDNLKYYKKDITSVPFIIQYNKRDLDNILSIAELNSGLNTLDVPYYASNALQGPGVVETLTAICKLVLKQMDRTSAKKQRPRAEEPSMPVPEPKPAPLPSPPLSFDQNAELDEPIIKIFNDEEENAAPEPAAPPSGIGIGIGTGTDMAGGPDIAAFEPLRFEEPSVSMNAEPEINLETPSFSADLESPISFNEPSLPGTFPGLDPEPAGETGGVRIVACGQAQKISDTAIQVPVSFKIPQTNKEGNITITITFDDFKLRG